MAVLDLYLEAPGHPWTHLERHDQCERRRCPACVAWRVAARAARKLEAEFRREGKSAMGAYVLVMYGMRELARWPVSDGKGYEIDFVCAEYIPHLGRETAASKILGLRQSRHPDRETEASKILGLN